MGRPLTWSSPNCCNAYLSPEPMKLSPNSIDGVYTRVEDLLKLRYLAQDLTLEARKKSSALAEGSVRTRYRGRGMEFAEVRPYQAGDDIRTIDWRVTARMQSPYTKLFQEEHERPVFVFVDQRSSMFFGSRNCFKSVFAAQLAALIGWIASRNNDRIGALIFGDHQQKDIRARRGKHAVLELLNQLSTFNNALHSPLQPADAIDLPTMLQEASRIARPGSMVLLLSDFHDFDEKCVQPLSVLSRRSDVVAVHIYDALEKQLPVNSTLTVTNRRQKLTLQTRNVADPFTRTFIEQQNHLKATLRNRGIQYVNGETPGSVDQFARELFSGRKGKSRNVNAGTAG